MLHQVEDALNYVLHWEGKPSASKKEIERARDHYINRYVDTVSLAEIEDERVRYKAFDMFMDMDREGIKLIQRAVGVKQDGGFGYITLHAVNSACPEDLLQRLANLSSTLYDAREGSQEAHTTWRKRAASLGRIGVNSPWHKEQ